MEIATTTIIIATTAAAAMTTTEVVCCGTSGGLLEGDAMTDSGSTVLIFIVEITSARML